MEKDLEFNFSRSIYDGDSCFSKIDDTKFQYKFGEDGTSKSFILEVIWGSDYPEDYPDFSMDSFYNQHILKDVKTHIIQSVKTEAEAYLGMSMTFTLFEHVKENLESLLADQPEEIQTASSSVNEISDQLENSDLNQESSKSGGKKEPLTKAQKRRMWNRGGLETEDRPRGWNWVDIVRHLSQTGVQS